MSQNLADDKQSWFVFCTVTRLFWLVLLGFLGLLVLLFHRWVLATFSCCRSLVSLFGSPTTVLRLPILPLLLWITARLSRSLFSIARPVVAAGKWISPVPVFASEPLFGGMLVVVPEVCFSGLLWDWEPVLLPGWAIWEAGVLKFVSEAQRPVVSERGHQHVPEKCFVGGRSWVFLPAQIGMEESLSNTHRLERRNHWVTLLDEVKITVNGPTWRKKSLRRVAWNMYKIAG